MKIQQVLSLLTILALLGFSSSVAADKASDANLVAIYNQVNSFDIETGTLAILKGKNKAVIELGEMVKSDHSHVMAEMQKLALAEGINPVLPMSRVEDYKKHKEVINEMVQLSGAEFDRAYLLHEVAFHAAAIEAIKNVILPNTSNPNIKTFIKDILPGFEKHLQMTEQAARGLGYL